MDSFVFARINVLVGKDVTKGYIHAMMYQDHAVGMVFASKMKRPEKLIWVTDANVTFGGVVRKIKDIFCDKLKRRVMFMLMCCYNGLD